MAGKVFFRVAVSEQNGVSRSFPYSSNGSSSTGNTVEFRKYYQGERLSGRICSAPEGFWPYSCKFTTEHAFVCRSMGTHRSEAAERTRSSEDRANARDQLGDDQDGSYAPYSTQGLADACKFVYNDARYVNERVQSDIILLSRGITWLNDCASKQIAVLQLECLKLDGINLSWNYILLKEMYDFLIECCSEACTKANTEKIDLRVKEKAAYLHHIATILKNKAQSDLKRASDQHWSDGALVADLRRADFLVRHRATRDAYTALKFIQDIQNILGNKLYQQSTKKSSYTLSDKMGFITLEKHEKALYISATEVSNAVQEAFWSMSSALSEADSIDYTDPEELELLVAALMDLDAMDGKLSASLLAECSSSADVNTRKALANALASAPSMWILGNAGMGALQRLAQDINPAVATAASKAISELKQQWELEEGDNLRFMINHFSPDEDTDDNNEQDNI